jgi:hypothetical protein
MKNPTLELVLHQFNPIYITKPHLCNNDFKYINPYKGKVVLVLK